MVAHATDNSTSIARALDFLVRNHQGGVTVEKVASDLGEAVSAPYIYALRSGHKRNPTVKPLEILARYFGVGVDFFFTDDPPAAYGAAGDRAEALTSPDEPCEEMDDECPPDPRVSAAAQPNLAERLQRLFEHSRRPDGKMWSMRQVSAAAAERGVSLSIGFLHDLRRGITDNPNMRQMEALAKVFDVHPAYFFDDDKALALAARKREAVEALADERVRRIALRAKELSTHDYRLLEAVLAVAIDDAAHSDGDS